MTIGENGVSESDIFIHDETDRTLATLLAAMQPPDFPEVMGVIYCDPADSYVDLVYAQLAEAKKKNGRADFNALLSSGHTWTVEG